jgi:PAS domain-containing protein
VDSPQRFFQPYIAEGERIYSGFILDITERKQAEQEYLRSERKIKAMSQAAEDALVMIDGGESAVLESGGGKAFRL